MAETQHLDQATLRWDRGEATLKSLGGMLAPVRFDLEDGRSIAPLHVSPWQGEEMTDQSGILSRLRGDWPCIPFGTPSDRSLPSPWCTNGRSAGERPSLDDDHPHGYGANHHWSLAQLDTHRLTASIRYPQDNPIEGLERHVEGVPGRSEIACNLTVIPRRDCHLPIGLHPVFRLPEGEGEAILDVGPHRTVWSHPLDEDPPLSLLQANRHFENLDSLRSREDQPLSLTRLPLAEPSETLLLLSGVCGRVALTNMAERYRVALHWDVAIFPSLMLWISNRGRQHSPWNGRHLALGIKPVRAAFDLGVDVSTRANPLKLARIETSYPFRAGTPLTTQYRISVESI